MCAATCHAYGPRRRPAAGVSRLRASRGAVWAWHASRRTEAPKAHGRRSKPHLERGMKATDLVLTQHREVEQLFEQLETESEGDKKGIREELAECLVAHAV